MPLSVDMGLEELKRYKPTLTKKADFRNFWKTTFEEQERFPVNAEAERLEYPVKGVRVYDASYCGFNGQKIKAWYLEPVDRGPGGKVPAMICFSGYTWARGYISQHLNDFTIYMEVRYEIQIWPL